MEGSIGKPERPPTGGEERDDLDEINAELSEAAQESSEDLQVDIDTVTEEDPTEYSGKWLFDPESNPDKEEAKAEKKEVKKYLEERFSTVDVDRARDLFYQDTENTKELTDDKLKKYGAAAVHVKWASKDPDRLKVVEQILSLAEKKPLADIFQKIASQGESLKEKNVGYLRALLVAGAFIREGNRGEAELVSDYGSVGSDSDKQSQRQLYAAQAGNYVTVLAEASMLNARSIDDVAGLLDARKDPSAEVGVLQNKIGVYAESKRVPKSVRKLLEKPLEKINAVADVLSGRESGRLKAGERQADVENIAEEINFPESDVQETAKGYVYENPTATEEAVDLEKRQRQVALRQEQRQRHQAERPGMIHEARKERVTKRIDRSSQERTRANEILREYRETVDIGQSPIRLALDKHVIAGDKGRERARQGYLDVIGNEIGRAEAIKEGGFLNRASVITEPLVARMAVSKNPFTWFSDKKVVQARQDVMDSLHQEAAIQQASGNRNSYNFLEEISDRLEEMQHDKFAASPNVAPQKLEAQVQGEEFVVPERDGRAQLINPAPLDADDDEYQPAKSREAEQQAVVEELKKRKEKKEKKKKKGSGIISFIIGAANKDKDES